MGWFLTDIFVNIYNIKDKQDKYIRILFPPKRLFIYSGKVATPLAIKTGKNIHPSTCNINMALSSNAPTPIPLAAPEPAKPIKCSLPILLANNDAPTLVLYIWN